ncbi:hypothetical protein CL614_06205 [archaeon]|nr:hypothetical protein [archaeon]|tara:strand:+ start:2340 stop:2573 length:234 start_codon:yes stop_codon:yes gene_type:complete
MVKESRIGLAGWKRNIGKSVHAVRRTRIKHKYIDGKIEMLSGVPVVNTGCATHPISPGDRVGIYDTEDGPRRIYTFQ